MAIQQGVTPVHWSYFLALEDDLYNLARYVDFSKANFDVFSIEIARILLGSSAEVDSVLKQLCKRIDPGCPASSINAYFPHVTGFSQKFINFQVSIHRFGMNLKPWEDWQVNAPPKWWAAHNKVKHHRHSHFHDATLKNCLNSMAALLVSVLHLYSEEGKDGRLVGIPKLFSIPDAMGGGQQWGAMGHSQLFYLNDADNPYFQRS